MKKVFVVISILMTAALKGIAHSLGRTDDIDDSQNNKEINLDK